MSKIGQHFMELPISDIDDSNLDDDPGYKAWSEQLDKEDIDIQDNEPEPF